MSKLQRFISRMPVNAPIVLALLLALPARADRTLLHEAVVDAPASDVWEALTTSKGFESWAVAHAEIDLRIGGEMRTHYDPNGVIGDKNTIVNQILAFEPQRMLTIRNTHAPEGFKRADLFQQTWTVISLEPMDEMPQRTHVRIAGLGWGEGAEWDELYNFFQSGNQQTLDELQKKFSSNSAPAADDAQATLKVFSRMAGGEWIYKGEESDGKALHVRNVVELGPDGNSMIGRGWMGGLGDDPSLGMHSACLVWLEAGTDGKPDEVRFTDVNQAGDVSRGTIKLAAPGSLQWDWRTRHDGEPTHYRITESFTDHDHYHLHIEKEDEAGEWMDMVNFDFQRVEKAPPEFLKVRQK